mgnify:CR=1 FL=1
MIHRAANPHPYIGPRFHLDGDIAEVVRVIGWYSPRGQNFSSLGGAIVNVYLERSQRYAGHVHLSHELAQAIIDRRERGLAA